MRKEVVSNKQAISIMILFLSGTASGSTFGISAGRDLWIAIILAVLAALVTAVLFGVIHYNFPDQNMFQILENCFGKIIGKFIGLLFCAYFLQSAIDVLTNMGFFIRTVTLPETPRTATSIIIISLCLWAVKEGIEVLGRWSEFFIPFYILAIFVAVTMLIPQMDFNNIRPLLYDGLNPVLQGAFKSFTFPFGEIVVFSAVFSNFETRKSPYKVYIISLLISGTLVLMISTTDILVLGVDLVSSLYYPSYNIVRRIDIGQFLQRLEILSALVFILGGFVKVSVYLMASCKGTTEIFGYRDYRFVAFPLSQLIAIMAIVFHKSVFQFFEWNDKTWPYLALLFQLILPLAMLCAWRIKRTFLQ